MYNSVSNELKKRFGCKVYKIALSSGCTCPNRDGTIGVGGCIFCSEHGSGDFAQDAQLPIKEQIRRGKQLVAAKNPNGRYIAYFQSYTNTYGPVEMLEPKFMEALADEEVVILSVATRPDCISDEMLALLARLNQIKPVWVELGLQTIHERTAEYIRRGYSLAVYDETIARLQSCGIEVIVHVILGLPFESKEDMLATVKYVADSGADGIKLQLLHVLKGTDLAAEYAAGKFEVLTMEQYLDILRDAIALLPPQMVVHRLTGDGSRRDLIAPNWSADKKRVLNEINRLGL